MKRTISAMRGKGSLSHNSRQFIAENVDSSRTPLNIEYRNEDLMDNGVFVEINTLEIEVAAANDMYQRSELDWLVYNAPVEYAELILNGDLSQYLKNVTVYKHLES